MVKLEKILKGSLDLIQSPHWRRLKQYTKNVLMQVAMDFTLENIRHPGQLKK